jgi:Rrf2 family transcriptional regulator, cysteine metabolism repressor
LTDNNTKPIMFIDNITSIKHMKLTTKSEYSLLALIYIARHEKNSFIKIEDICEKYGLSKKYLEQIFYILKSSRYIKTKRGAHGGYSLAVPAKKITVAEIVRLMDGALAPTESVSKYFFSHTPLEKEVKIIKVLREIRNYIAERLENLTLADLI